MKPNVDSISDLLALDPIKVEAKMRSDRTGLSCPASDILVKQEFVEECDINVIMARFFKSGVVTHLARTEPYYGDVSELATYQESLALVSKAESAFAELPAEVRRSMDNDPIRLHDWLSDPKNAPMAVKHGLVNSPPKESIQKVEVINPVVPPVVKP